MSVDGENGSAKYCAHLNTDLVYTELFNQVIFQRILVCISGMNDDGFHGESYDLIDGRKSRVR
jgi:hypothetical protein